MSLNSTISSISQHISDAWDAINEMGGEIPEEKNLVNLVPAILELPGGEYGDITVKKPSGGIEIIPLDTEETFAKLYGTNDIVIKGQIIERNNIIECRIGRSISSISDAFLNSCHFLIKLSGYEQLTSIGNNFLSFCQDFNQGLIFPNLQSVGSDFLASALNFNSAISMPQVTTVGQRFMEYCHAFNAELNLPMLQQIGNGFLRGCDNFNQLLNLPEVRGIGAYFLANVTKFDSPLNLPKVTSIGGNFMQLATAFAQPLTLPTSLRNIASGFMDRANNFIGPLNVFGAGYPNDNTSLSTTNNQAQIYKTGVTLTGTMDNAWKKALPNSDVSPYRKLR